MEKKSLKEQFSIQNKWLIKRLDILLPKLMKKEDIDMWIVIGSENNEDPVLKTMLPKEFFGALGKNILVFIKNSDGMVERLTVSRPMSAIDEYYESVWYKQKGKDWKSFYKLAAKTGKTVSINLDNYEEETEWECLKRIVDKYNPSSIGLNFSEKTKFADGISFTEYNQIKEAIGEGHRDKIVSADPLAVGWLETRIEEEIEYYEELTKVAQNIIKKAYSNEVIDLGKTTSGDVRWFMMQEAVNYGYSPWFEATVWINRKGVSGLGYDTVIEHGDLLHCDFGIEYMGLCTDIQEMCYVLKDEESVPAGILNGHRNANRLQDIFIEEIRCGITGNDVFSRVIERANEENLRPCLYTHPIGFHGHGAGPTIGLFSAQKPLPRGERVINGNTMYALELNVTATIPEWDNQEIMYGLETDILLRDDDSVHFFGVRQISPHITIFN